MFAFRKKNEKRKLKPEHFIDEAKKVWLSS